MTAYAIEWHTPAGVRRDDTQHFETHIQAVAVAEQAMNIIDRYWPRTAAGTHYEIVPVRSGDE